MLLNFLPVTSIIVEFFFETLVVNKIGVSGNEIYHPISWQFEQGNDDQSLDLGRSWMILDDFRAPDFQTNPSLTLKHHPFEHPNLCAFSMGCIHDTH